MKTVFLCSDAHNMPIGNIDNEPLKFQIEISITAQRYSKNIFTFNVVTNSWDEFDIDAV